MLIVVADLTFIFYLFILIYLIWYSYYIFRVLCLRNIIPSAILVAHTEIGSSLRRHGSWKQDCFRCGFKWEWHPLKKCQNWARNDWIWLDSHRRNLVLAHGWIDLARVSLYVARFWPNQAQFRSILLNMTILDLFPWVQHRYSTGWLCC